MKTKLILVSALMLAQNACKSDDSETAAVANHTLSIKGASSLELAADTSSAKLTAYEFWISENETCDDPIQVFEDADGKEVDMLDGPSIGSGAVPAATYNCVIMVMSDQVKFVPATTTGVCEAGEEYALDVFRPYSETEIPTSVLPDGTEVVGEAGEQKVAIFISTLSTSTGGGEGGNAFAPATASTKTDGINLDSALVVTEDASGTMVMDTSGKVESNSGDCDMQPPVFGFK
jgi:hypothetical protein